ncbi:MAG: DUF4271 domain-containing protein [Prevotella sp.]|nr:DUF4271 domain-containing protein [Prevotella sp.]
MISGDSITYSDTSAVVSEASPGRDVLSAAQVTVPRVSNAVRSDRDTLSAVDTLQVAADSLAGCDTIYIYEQGVRDTITELDITSFDGDNFFTEKIPYIGRVTGVRQGAAGDTIPYSVATDDVMSTFLVGCLVATIIALSAVGRFVVRQVKLFFYNRRGETSVNTLTSSELRAMTFLSFQTCFMYALLYFAYVSNGSEREFYIEPYRIIGLLFAVFVVFFAAKGLIVSIVNRTFFSGNERRRYNESSLFLTAMEGLFLLPVVYLLAYFGLTFHAAAIYVILVVIIFRLLTIYKQKQIFFCQKAGLAGFSLYLCTLELAPFLMVWNVLILILAQV